MHERQQFVVVVVAVVVVFAEQRPLVDVVADYNEVVASRDFLELLCSCYGPLFRPVDKLAEDKLVGEVGHIPVVDKVVDKVVVPLSLEFLEPILEKGKL